MSEIKFKVGDHVRLKEEFKIARCGCLTTIPIGEIGVVVDEGADDVLYVSFKENIVYLRLRFPQVELCDPKTAFLSDLKDLLERYDAQIGAVGDDEYTTISIKVGEFELFYTHKLAIGCRKLPITPNNIMDYEQD